jgi:hypothetical protein
MTICIVGDTQDLSSVYFGWAARQAGHRVLELDEEQLGATWSFAFDDRPATIGVIEIDRSRVDFADLVGVFARFAPEPGPPPEVELDDRALERLRAGRAARAARPASLPGREPSLGGSLERIQAASDGHARGGGLSRARVACQQ